MTYQKFHSERFSRLLASIIVSLSITLIYSCKKTDIANQADIVKREDKIISQKKADDFFKLPADASPVLYRIANELQKQNKTQDFINDFIKKEGFPVWHKASIEAGGHKIKNNSNPGFDGEGLEDTTVYIPLVVGNQHYVHGFLKATVSDTVEVKIFRQNDYIYFPFQTPLATPGVTTAENYALRMMLMDKEVFSSNEFKIRDKRLFNNSTDYRDTANIQRFIKLDTTSSGGNYFSNGASVNSYTYEMCYTVVTLTNTTCPTFSGSWGSNVAGSCWIVSYSELCITYEVGGEEEGGSGGSWPFPPGGGGGGNPPGGGGGAPCEYFGESITSSVVPIECEPGPGENPWPVVETSAEYDPSITNNDPDIEWWEDNTTDFPAQMLPSWSSMNSNFPKKTDGTEMCGADVYSLIGGQVLANMPPGSNPNACALRVSRALNYSGINIPVIPGHTYQGADGKNYFLSSAKLYNFMKKTFKVPPNSANSIETFSKSQGGANGNNFQSLLSGKQGIYLMQASYPAFFGALGHATLYDGTSCVHNTCDGIMHDGCYFKAKGGVEKITLFKLN